MAHPNNRLRARHIVEVAPARHDDCVAFANDFRASRDEEGGSDAVGPGVEEDHCTCSCGVVDYLLQGVGVVVDTISCCAGTAHALERGDGEVVVLGLGLDVVFASAEEGCGARVGGDDALELCWSARSVFVALAPACNGHAS